MHVLYVESYREMVCLQGLYMEHDSYNSNICLHGMNMEHESYNSNNS